MTAEDVERVTGGLASEPIMLKSMSVLRLEPGDALVFKLDRIVSRDTTDHIQEVVSSIWPGTRALILEAGMDIGVVRRSITPDPYEP